MRLSSLHQGFLYSFFTTAFASNASTYTFSTQSSEQVFSLALTLNTTSNDVNFNMSAPSNYSWVGFGFGGQMKNSLMFIGYPGSNAGEAVLSTRLSQGHSQPSYTSSVDTEVMKGSISNGMYEISAVCKNCTTWSLGSLDTTSTNQPFIFALGAQGQAISSNSMTASIDMHQIYKSFTLDLTRATATVSNTNGATGSVVTGGASGSSTTSGGFGSSTTTGDYTTRRVHGIFMAFAFVLLFPIGVLLLRVLESVLLHAICQAIAVAFVVVGLGSGIYLSQQLNYTSYNSAHQVIGLVLFSFLIIQLLGGLIHHIIFKRYGKRSILGKVHIVLGPLLLVLGIVNTPLGLNMAGDGRYNTAYIIVVAILGAAFLGARFWAAWHKRNKTQSIEKQEVIEMEDGSTTASDKAKI